MTSSQPFEINFKNFLELLRYVWTFSPPRIRYLLLPLALTAGLSRNWVMIVINQAAASSATVALHYWLPVFALVFTFVLVASFLYHVFSTAVTSYISNDMRLKLLAGLLKAQPSFIDKYQHGTIYHILTTDVSVVASFVTTVLNLLPSIVFLFIAVPQLFLLSKLAGFFALVVMGGGILIYTLKQAALVKLNTDARQLDVNYFESVSNSLQGLRELRLHIPRRLSFLQHTRKNLEILRTLLIRVTKIYEAGEFGINALKYLLLGGVVFLVPFLAETEVSIKYQLLTFILFSLIPFEQIVSSYPAVIAAMATFFRIRELHEKLQQFENVSEHIGSNTKSFGTIEMKGVVARHHSRETSGFVLGPIDFRIKQGEIVFFVGHNGSGKTTFMNVLAGLLDIDEGQLLVDGAVLAPVDMATYRARISSVFTHYHVFREMHGLEMVSKEQAEAAIGRVGLTGLTTIENSKVTRLDLSAGQKRRLALAVVLMENRDILILDEFVADQDPQQREYFFYTLLPQFKAEGKTVIVSTHDLHWMDCADKVYQFEAGKIKDITPERKKAAPVKEAASA